MHKKRHIILRKCIFNEPGLVQPRTLWPMSADLQSGATKKNCFMFECSRKTSAKLSNRLRSYSTLSKTVIRSDVCASMRCKTATRELSIEETDFISAQPRTTNSAVLSKQPCGVEMLLASVNQNVCHCIRRSSLSLGKTYCRHYAKPLFWVEVLIVPQKLWMINMTSLAWQDKAASAGESSWERG